MAKNLWFAWIMSKRWTGSRPSGRRGGDDSEAQDPLSLSLRRLIRQVGMRLACVHLARWWYRVFLIGAGLYALALVASRLLAIAPGAFTPVSLLVLLILSFLIALIGRKRVASSDAARAIDHAEGSRDLFLTSVLLDERSQDLAKLVEAGAAARAAQIDPRRVVRFGLQRHILWAGLTVILLLAAMRWLPQLDPFGREALRQQRQARREELKETRRATTVRKAQLARKTPPRERSEEAELRIGALKKTFTAMKPGQPKENARALTEQQQELGKSWQRAKHASMSLGALPRLDQGFGAESPRAEQWRKQLADGDTQSMQQELRDLQELARKMAALPDGDARRKFERELSRRLQELARFADDKMAARALSAALNRALAQAKMGGATELSMAALEALAESLDLADLELSQLQQAMNDLKAMEEALRTLQLAQRCNQQQPLDGNACTNCNSLAAYAALYGQMLAQQGGCGACAGCVAGTGCTGGGKGLGMKGPGQGEGGQAPENDALVTDHISETSRSAMRAGKILMQWQTDESADKGRAAVNVDQQIRELREGVSEAVLNERIPPAYHDGIRRYFDALAPGDGDAN